MRRARTWILAGLVTWAAAASASAQFDWFSAGTTSPPGPGSGVIRTAAHTQDAPSDELVEDATDGDGEEVTVGDGGSIFGGGGCAPLSAQGCGGGCGGSCGNGGCSSCGSPGACSSCRTCSDCCLLPCKNCCPPRRRTRVYGDYLYLRPGNADLTYALPRNGVAPIGNVGVANTGFQPGFRAGFDVAVDPCSSIGASYTQFESQTNSSIRTDTPSNLGSVLLHPATQSAANVYLFANANYDIDFRFADVEYRALLKRSARTYLDYTVGLRYAELNQDLLAGYSLTGFSPTTVQTQINFEGLGIRLGLEGERCLRHGMFFYGQGYSSFMGGSFRSSYTQTNSLNTVEAASGFKDNRVLSLLEAEAGFGWQSKTGNVRIRAGYYFAGWFNTLTTSTWIEGVRNNNFIDLHETLAFSGLRVGGDIRW